MKIFLLTSFFVATTAIQAATSINLIFNSGSGTFVMPDGSSLLPDNSTVEYGVFDATAFSGLAASQYDYTNIANIFSSYGSVNITGGEVAVTGLNLTGGSTGDQLSVFVYTPDFSSIAVFSSSNSLWDYPADPGAASLSTPTVNDALLGQINVGSPNTLQLIAAVPEPSTYAMMLGALALGFVAYRRRRS